MTTLVDRLGNLLELPRVAVAEMWPAYSLVNGAPQWQIAELGCAVILFEGDFTVTLNLAAFDEGSKGQITYSCTGPHDEATAASFTVGCAPEQSINEALEKVLIDRLVKQGAWRLKAAA